MAFSYKTSDNSMFSGDHEGLWYLEMPLTIYQGIQKTDMAIGIIFRYL